MVKSSAISVRKTCKKCIIAVIGHKCVSIDVSSSSNFTSFHDLLISSFSGDIFYKFSFFLSFFLRNLSIYMIPFSVIGLRQFFSSFLKFSCFLVLSILFFYWWLYNKNVILQFLVKYSILFALVFILQKTVLDSLSLVQYGFLQDEDSCK